MSDDLMADLQASIRRHSTRPRCCERSCDDAAEFYVVHGCGSPECDTYACRSHVGDVLDCTHPELGREGKPWTVFGPAR